MAYEGNSIVDYLKSVGQDSSYGARTKLAGTQGIKGYTGSAQQNTSLLNTLRSGGGTSSTSSTSSNTSSQLTNQDKPPTSSEEITPYLNSYQNSMFDSMNTPAMKIPTIEEFKGAVAPSTPAPTPLDRMGDFNTFRADLGVTELETSLTTIKDQVTAEQDAVRAARGIEEGKPVPLGVISGRVTEEERVANQRIDSLVRQQARITDELNIKYNLVNTFMNFKSLDYQDAVASYNAEYTRNLDAYNAITGLRKEARSNMEYDQSTARANLTTMMNSITQGNLSYGDLSSDQKLMVSKLEVQSGMPIGFMSQVKEKIDPKANIIANWESEGQYHVLSANPNGGDPVLQTYGTKKVGSGGGGSSNAFQSSVAKGRDDLASGTPWGTVWDRLHLQYPDVSNEELDTYLGKSQYYNKETDTWNAPKQEQSAGDKTEISKAKQALVKAGDLSTENAKRIENDPDYRAYIMATYGDF